MDLFAAGLLIVEARKLEQVKGLGILALVILSPLFNFLGFSIGFPWVKSKPLHTPGIFANVLHKIEDLNRQSRILGYMLP